MKSHHYNLNLSGREKHVPDAIFPGQAVIYARKSTVAENSSKSIADQVEVCREVAVDYDLPISEDDILTEVAGHGGDEWWEGGGLSGIAGDDGIKQRTRPALTRIMVGIVAGTIKAVIVYSQDRLWRSVGICDAVLERMALYGVQLYDRNGPVDISTPEGRQQVRNTAVAAQNFREMCSVNSPRGVHKSRDKGKVVTSADVLGFRSAGRHTGKIIHVAEEQEVVRRIFRLFLDGEGNGPMSYEQIAALLQNEGYKWTPDLHQKRGKKRNDETEGLIYAWQIKRVLTDCRYQGRQPHAGAEHDCPAYLVDGEAVVSVALYEYAQTKIINSKRTGNRGRENKPLTGIIRCGLCGQGLHMGHVKTLDDDGNKVIVPYWLAVRQGTSSWCTHRLPSLRMALVDQYIEDHLMPLLLAEIQDQRQAADNVALVSERAALQRQICQAEQKYEELPDLLGKVSVQLIAKTEARLMAKMAELRARLRTVEQSLKGQETILYSLEHWKQLPQPTQRDAIRSILRWMAVIPTVQQPTEDTKRKRPRAADDAGTLVFLSAWGTYHCAKIWRSKTSCSGARPFLLRPAQFDEVIGSVADFPNPQSFVAGMERAYKGRRLDFYLWEIAPGYNPHEARTTDVEFAVEFEIEDEP